MGLCCEKKNDLVKEFMEYEVEGSRPRSRRMRSWSNVMQKDFEACKLNREDAMDHSR